MFSAKFISGSQLKWIAIITMFLDHTAKIISFQPFTIASVPSSSMNYPLYQVSQTLFPIFIMIGRLAFPIFCFLLVEGFLHTANKQKYAVRLLLFALISQIPYSLAFSQQLFSLSNLNVFFTLFIGFLVMVGLDKFKPFSSKYVFYQIVIVVLGVVLANWLQTDYGGKIGILLIVTLYLFRNHFLYQALVGSLIILQNSIFGILAFPLLFFYNGTRGKQWKYFFYLFYPIHLLLLTAIQYFIVSPYFL